MRTFFLLGTDIKNSLSPLIHNQLFKLKKMPHIYSLRYTPFDIFSQLNFGGLSLTMPYKQFYSTFVNCQCDFSKKYKIINTIVKNSPNQLLGYNTDLYGIEQTLNPLLINKMQKKNVSNQTLINNNNHNKLKQNNNCKQTFKAMVVGAGSTALTFIYYLMKKNIPVMVVNRGEQKAVHIMNQFQNVHMCITHTGIRHKHDSSKNCSVDKSLLNKCNILIVSIPRKGLYQQWNWLQPLLSSHLHFQNIIYMDVNYGKEIDPITSLLSNNILHGKGLDMLIWQALQQNRLFCHQYSYRNDKLYKYYFDKVTLAIQNSLQKQ